MGIKLPAEWDDEASGLNRQEGTKRIRKIPVQHRNQVVVPKCGTFELEEVLEFLAENIAGKSQTSKAQVKRLRDVPYFGRAQGVQQLREAVDYQGIIPILGAEIQPAVITKAGWC